ncbi:MAG: hypothetical protein K2W82_07785 [Candidatus Obscuribacterales bacterium]|nr:hypothetical protein [Candidatus Obscuribacterales bacterium]
MFCTIPAMAQSGMRLPRNNAASASKYKPLTGAVDYREPVVDSNDFAPLDGRTDVAQLQGVTNGMQMRAGVGANRQPLRSAVPLFGSQNPFNLDANRGRLPGDLNEQELNVLKSHDIVIMQDRSSSMGEKEYFAQGEFPRWYWCLAQANDFGRQTQRLPNWSFTLVLFSSKYDVYHNVRLPQVPSIYQSRHGLYVGTKLAEPMSEQLNDYFRRRASGRAKPLIIAVVTDGKPQDDEDLCDLIIDATHHMRNRDDISITFLQVGTDDEGRKKLRKFDYKLVKKGARFDIVNVMPFETVTQMGLTRALVTAVQNANSGY